MLKNMSSMMSRIFFISTSSVSFVSARVAVRGGEPIFAEQPTHSLELPGRVPVPALTAFFSTSSSSSPAEVVMTQLTPTTSGVLSLPEHAEFAVPRGLVPTASSPSPLGTANSLEDMYESSWNGDHFSPSSSPYTYAECERLFQRIWRIFPSTAWSSLTTTDSSESTGIGSGAVDAVLSSPDPTVGPSDASREGLPGVGPYDEAVSSLEDLLNCSEQQVQEHIPGFLAEQFRQTLRRTVSPGFSDIDTIMASTNQLRTITDLDRFVAELKSSLSVEPVTVSGQACLGADGDTSAGRSPTVRSSGKKEPPVDLNSRSKLLDQAASVVRKGVKEIHEDLWIRAREARHRESARIHIGKVCQFLAAPEYREELALGVINDAESLDDVRSFWADSWVHLKLNGHGLHNCLEESSLVTVINNLFRLQNEELAEAIIIFVCSLQWHGEDGVGGGIGKSSSGGLLAPPTNSLSQGALAPPTPTPSLNPPRHGSFLRASVPATPTTVTGNSAGGSTPSSSSSDGAAVSHAPAETHESQSGVVGEETVAVSAESRPSPSGGLDTTSSSDLLQEIDPVEVLDAADEEKWFPDGVVYIAFLGSLVVFGIILVVFLLVPCSTGRTMTSRPRPTQTGGAELTTSEDEGWESSAGGPRGHKIRNVESGLATSAGASSSSWSTVVPAHNCASSPQVGAPSGEHAREERRCPPGEHVAEFSPVSAQYASIPASPCTPLARSPPDAPVELVVASQHPERASATAARSGCWEAAPNAVPNNSSLHPNLFPSFNETLDDSTNRGLAPAPTYETERTISFGDGSQGSPGAARDHAGRESHGGSWPFGTSSGPSYCPSSTLDIFSSSAMVSAELGVGGDAELFEAEGGSQERALVDARSGKQPARTEDKVLARKVIRIAM